jgi:hypothetical protein
LPIASLQVEDRFSFDRSSAVGAWATARRDAAWASTGVAPVIFLDAGTPVVYSAKEEGAELVYVTYPHWSEAVLTSE